MAVGEAGFQTLSIAGAAAQPGHVYGRLFTAWGTAGLLAPLVGGILFDLTGSYGATLIASLVLSLAGAGMAQFYRESRSGELG